MTETLTGAPARNYIGGEWRESSAGETYEKRSPWRPSVVTGVFPASTADDARAAIEAARDGFPGVVVLARWTARCVLHEGRRRDRGPRRADRAGHDGRDGQAAARGADGGTARGRDPSLRGGRGLAADR